MEDAEIIEWLVESGDRVRKEDEIVTIQTDKVDTTIASPFSGIIAEIRYAEGQSCVVGEVICTIETSE
jgi:pyruvate/2-oxoglutarate dehydrogenase complex dihydrolipoamide acyltransferase (E2) component